MTSIETWYIHEQQAYQSAQNLSTLSSVQCLEWNGLVFSTLNPLQMVTIIQQTSFLHLKCLEVFLSKFHICVLCSHLDIFRDPPSCSSFLAN